MNVNEDHARLSRFLNIYRFSTILTIPIYLEVFWLIIWKSKNVPKEYRIILTSHVGLCCLQELYGFHLMRPVIIPPIVGIYADGLLSSIGIPVLFQFMILCFIVKLNTILLCHIGFYRLQLVMPRSYRFHDKFLKYGYIILKICYANTILTTLSYLFLIEDQHIAKLYMIQTIYPVPEILWSDNYAVVSNLNQKKDIVTTVTFVYFIMYAFIGMILPLVSTDILIWNRAKSSPGVAKAQREYLLTMFSETSINVLFVFLPLLTFRSMFLGNVYSYYFTFTAFILMLSNGIASTLILVLTTKSYRKIIAQQTRTAWKCLKRRNKVTYDAKNESIANRD